MCIHHSPFVTHPRHQHQVLFNYVTPINLIHRQVIPTSFFHVSFPLICILLHEIWSLNDSLARIITREQVGSYYTLRIFQNAVMIEKVITKNMRDHPEQR